MSNFILFETTALSSDSPAERAIRLGTIGYNHPSAPGYFYPHISEAQSITIERGIYEARLAFGFGNEQVALLNASNINGQYDHLGEWGFGNPGTIKIGQPGDVYEALTEVFTGTVSHVLPSGEDVEFAWRGRSTALDRAISEAFFLGSNADSPSPLTEGLQTDIGGQRKKRCGGVNYNIEPVLVNSIKRIFAWRWDAEGNHAPTYQVTGVRLSGSAWISAGDYTTIAAMAAANPGVGYFVTCLAESALMMGGSAPLGGGLRIDVTIEASASDRYASNLAAALIVESGLSVDTDSFNALATAMPYEAGYYAADETYREIIDELMGSVLGWAIARRTGSVICGTLQDLEAREPVATFNDSRSQIALRSNDIVIHDLEPILNEKDDDLAAPVKEVRVAYYPNDYPLQKDGVAAGVSEELRQQLSQAYRYTSVLEVPGIPSIHMNAVAITHHTRLVNASHAEAVRDQLADVVGYRKRYRVKSTLNPALAQTVRPGQPVTIIHPRYGFKEGAKVWIVKEKIDATLSDAEFEVLR